MACPASINRPPFILPSRSWPNCAADPRRSRAAPRCDTPEAAAAQFPELAPATRSSLESRWCGQIGHALGQIARLIHVAAAPHRDVIRQKLQRHNFQNWRQQLARRWNLDGVVRSDTLWAKLRG